MASKDFRVEYFRSGGNGGQNRDKVETAVRITHLPTGLKAQCQTDRSRDKNYKQAMATLENRIAQREASNARIEQARARAELHQGRVRTYNLVTNLVTDNIRKIKVIGAREVLDGNLERVL